MPAHLTLQNQGQSAGGFNRQRNSLDQNATQTNTMEIKKCETMGNNTPFDLKNTQMSSFMNQGDSTVNTKSEFDRGALTPLNDQSPLKFDNTTN